jgi:hypothetical protein
VGWFWEEHAVAFVVLLVFAAICLLVAAPRSPEAGFGPSESPLPKALVERFGPSESPFAISRQQFGCMLLGWGVIGVIVLLEVLR